MDMRGLAHFIQDIRKVTANKEEEQKRINVELAKIRAKFKESTSLSTYDRRKYVCKLMFISMLGYPVEFGHMEGVQLLAMPGAAEKLIGYLCLTVFLHEGHELMTLTTHIVTLDLLSGKDLNTSLALSAIANAGGRDFCEQMAEGVKGIILRPTVDIQLHKKAILTYLRVWRKYREVADLSDVVPLASEWITSPQYGLAAAAITFLTGVIDEKDKGGPSGQGGLFSKVPFQLVRLLARVILDKQTEPEYIYYGVPAPWLQAKAMRLLQYFPPFPPDDPAGAQLNVVLSKIVKATEKVVKDAQSLQKQRGTANRCNAMNSVLVELVGLVIQWKLEPRLLQECTDVVNTFIHDKKDANMRYMGLALMTRLSYVDQSYFDFAAHCRQYQTQIAVAMHDPDISLRKKALQLTYNVCTRNNVDDIVTELLKMLPAATPNFQRDLVLVIVALAEKFAVDVAWYTDTVTNVIATAGDYVPDYVWQRLVNVVVSNPGVQKHATERAFYLVCAAGKEARPGESASATTRHPDVLVRVAAFLLGEFGYQIALNSNSSAMDQVLGMQSKFAHATTETRAMLLTTFVKFYNLFDSPAVREKIVRVLSGFVGNLDCELQQRAVEYLALIQHASDAVLQATLEPLPGVAIEVGQIFQLLDASRTSGCGKTLSGGVTASAVAAVTTGTALGSEAIGAAPDVDIWALKARAKDEADARQSVLSGAPGTMSITSSSGAAAGAPSNSSVNDTSGAVSQKKSAVHVNANAGVTGTVRGNPTLEKSPPGTPLEEQPKTESGAASATAVPFRAPPALIGTPLGAATPSAVPPVAGGLKTTAAVDLDDIFDFGKSSTAAAALAPEGHDPQPRASSSSGKAAAAEDACKVPTPQELSKWHEQLCTSPSGTLYQDDHVLVTVAHEYRNADVRLTMTVAATAASAGLSEVNVKIASTSASLLIQSRDHPSTVPAGGSIKVDFAARSFAPFADSPTIRFSYVTGKHGPSRPWNVILSLPIVTTNFCAPYRVDSAEKAEALWANSPTVEGGPLERSWMSRGVVDADDVRRVMEKFLKMFAVRLPSADEVIGIAAFSVQPGGTPQFTPLVARVKLSGAQVIAKVKNPSQLLQQLSLDTLERGLQQLSGR